MKTLKQIIRIKLKYELWQFILMVIIADEIGKCMVHFFP